MKNSPLIIENNIPTVYQEVRRRKWQIVQYLSVIPLTIFVAIMGLTLTLAIVKVTGLGAYVAFMAPTTEAPQK